MQNSNFWMKLIRFCSNDLGSFKTFFQMVLKRLDKKMILYVYLTSYIVNFSIFNVLKIEPARLWWEIKIFPFDLSLPPAKGT